MRIAKMKILGTVVALFFCVWSSALLAAEERQAVKFIIYSVNPTALSPLIPEVADALGLARPAPENIITVEHGRDLRNAIIERHDVDWVCLAHYDKCRPLVELMRELIDKGLSTINFHSILLFDPYPVERVTRSKFAEVVRRALTYDPLDIRFEKIKHRIYNFYGEESSQWLRKIYPADKTLKVGQLTVMSDGRPYLKGVNIKCFKISAENKLECFPLTVRLNMKSYLRPFESVYGPSAELSRSASKVGEIIRYVDQNYLINTDLACLLANESPVNQDPPHAVIPYRNYSDPMVIMNRPTYWDGTNLQQIISSAGWLSWATWQKFGEAYVWSLKVLHDHQKDDVYGQIAREAQINAERNSVTPYFSAWLECYRSTFLKSFNYSYQWFNQEALVFGNPHKREIAHAIPRRSLCAGEYAYVDARRSVVQAALERAGIALRGKFPKIAIVASGGGIRAMLATLGFLRGLERANLLDTVTYVCGLSGSTWAIAPWISSGLTVTDYCKTVVPKVKLFKSVMRNILPLVWQRTTKTPENEIKTVFGQTYTWVDTWGYFISKNLLIEPNMQLSNQGLHIANGHKPFPIYTAVDIAPRTRDWFEFTPFEIGSLGRKVSIPAWSFGRYFMSGISQDFAPEQSLGYLLGIFGSAMGAKIKDVAEGVGLPNLTDREWNLTAAENPNFYFGIKDMQDSDQEVIKLVDAGADFNLPYPPISGIKPGRKADIIIFLDSSGEFGEQVGGEIRKTYNYARTNNMKLPVEMDRWCRLLPGQVAHTRDRRMELFPGNAAQGIPTVLYMPIALDLAGTSSQQPLIDEFVHSHGVLLKEIMNNEGATNDNLMAKYPTSTMSYAPAESNFLLDLMDINVRLSQQRILDAIQAYIRTMPD